MPTYQYSCTECGHFFEAVQSFSESSLSECPECGGKLRKVFNAVGVVFKGSGFYRNDSRGTSTSTSPAASGDTKSDSKSEGKSESKSEGKSETKTESKPVAKTEAKSA